MNCFQQREITFVILSIKYEKWILFKREEYEVVESENFQKMFVSSCSLNETKWACLR